MVDGSIGIPYEEKGYVGESGRVEIFGNQFLNVIVETVD